MKELIKINSMKEVNGMRFHDIEGGFGEGKKAMLVKEIATIHDRELKTVNQLINNNRNRFKDGIDIVDILNGHFELPLQELGFSNRDVSISKNIYLLSERGYSKLLKIMDDDLAWEKYDELVDGYFNIRKEVKKIRDYSAEEFFGRYEKNKKTFELTKEGRIPLEAREMFCIVPDSDKADMMIKLIDKFYPKKEVDKIIKEKKDKPKVNLKQKAIDIFKECFDKAYYATRGQYILFYKEPVYKCASKSGITKREFNKILLKYNMVKTERGGELPTCCIRIDNKNYRAIYLKAELLNSQE